MEMPKPRRTWIVGGAAIAVAVAWLWPQRPGIVVVVRNESGATVTDVIVQTTGLEFPVGDIPDGEAREVGITALSESSATLLYTHWGERCDEVVVGYFEGKADGVAMWGGTVEHTIGVSTWTTEGRATIGLPFLPTRRPLPAGRPSSK